MASHCCHDVHAMLRKASSCNPEALPYNLCKAEAAMLADRCMDCADKLSEVVAAVDKMLQRESSTSSLSSSPVDVRVESVARSVAKLGEIMKECGAFLDAFSQKGFLSRLANGSIHAHTFALLDRRLAQQSTELGSALDLQNM